jgi:CubicO group peptidase (beta-lactamase class C family)
VLVVVAAATVAQSAGTWIDDSWTVLLLVTVLLVSYALGRRLFVALSVAALVVVAATGVLAPRLATERTGDPDLLALLEDQQNMGLLAGFHDLVVAEVDLGNDEIVRSASVGDLTSTTPVEIGSVTKALTGLLIADSVQRGELRLNAPVSTYLPRLQGSPAGAVTMRELGTHTAGYADFGAATLRRAFLNGPVGGDWLTADHDQLLAEVRGGDLNSRGSYSYSSLGAATAGQATANAAGMTYADLMRTRLFQPLGMRDTTLQTERALVVDGRSPSGLPVQPWLFDAYAPAGAVVSTTHDLAILATALLDGTAPGMDAMTPIQRSDPSNTSIGLLWRISTWQTGQTITWHTGETAGYTAYFALDRDNGRAVIAVSDVGRDVGDIGSRLLAQRE